MLRKYYVPTVYGNKETIREAPIHSRDPNLHANGNRQMFSAFSSDEERGIPTCGGKFCCCNSTGSRILYHRSTVSRATQLEIRKLETIRHNFKDVDAPQIGLIGPRWVSLKYSQFTIIQYIYFSPGDIVKISTKNIQNCLNIIVTTMVNRNHKIFNVAYKKCSEINYSYAIHGKGQPRKLFYFSWSTFTGKRK